MRWIVFVVLAALALAFDEGIGGVLALGDTWHIQPSLCGVLAVFVALSAPRPNAVWACWILGLLLDLSNPMTTAGGRVVHLVGPYALGFAAGGQLILLGRTMVFRRRALTIGVMTFVLLLVVHAVAVMIFVIRSWYPGDPVFWTESSLGSVLVERFLMAVYSGIFAIPAGWLLVATMPLWGFQTITYRNPSMLKKA